MMSFTTTYAEKGMLGSVCKQTFSNNLPAGKLCHTHHSLSLCAAPACHLSDSWRIFILCFETTEVYKVPVPYLATIRPAQWARGECGDIEREDD